MPAGFTVDSSGNESDDSPSGCAAVDAVDTDTPGEVDTEITFEKAGTWQSIIAAYTLQPGQAEKSFAGFKNAVKSCATFDFPNEDGSVMKFTTKALPAPKLGDESFGIRSAATAEGRKIGLDVTAVRVGDVLAVVIHAAAGTPDSALSATLLTQAVKNLEAAAR